MTRYFNTEGSCNPKEHYMVKLNDRSKRIKKLLVDRKKYFIINRGRQYGKTTTLDALRRELKEQYIVLSLDFQQMGTEDFADTSMFVCAFAKKLFMAFRSVESEDKEHLQGMLSDFQHTGSGAGMSDLFECLSHMCEISSRPMVLMIDEVDSASNNQVFVDFLAQLRSYYLKREELPIFHSVILAGVYNIKNLKLKLRPEPDHQYNSPWNIAADFDIDMSFSADQIQGMLEEYESDYHTQMDIQAVAEEIYAYTSGYPVLVSSICKQLDEKLLGIKEFEKFETMKQVWTTEGIAKCVC